MPARHFPAIFLPLLLVFTLLSAVGRAEPQLRMPRPPTSRVRSRVPASGPTPSWSARYHAAGDVDDQGTRVAVDTAGNVYVTGASSNGANYDYLTVKYDTAGNRLWAARYNGLGNGDEHPYGIVVDASGNVFVTGDSAGGGTGVDYATVKYSPNGTQLWAARYNGPGNGADEGHALVVDGAGNVYVTGVSWGGSYDYATLKYNAGGVQQWAKRYNGTYNASGDVALALAVDGVGNVYVTGYSREIGSIDDYTTLKYDTNGNPLWAKHYHGPVDNDYATALAVDSAGYVYVTGYSKAGGSTNYDYATVKYSPDGAQLWVARDGGPGNGDDEPCAVAVDGAGNVYVTGFRTGNGTGYDYLTIKYDGSGAKQWERPYDGSQANGDSQARALALAPAGYLYVTGWAQSSFTGRDYVTLKYDLNGNQIGQAFSYNGPANRDDDGEAIAVDSAGNVIVSGRSGGSAVNYDYALVKYSTAGPQLWARRFDGQAPASARAVIMDGAGNVYVTGSSVGDGTGYDYATVKYSAAGLQLWVSRYNGPGNGEDRASGIVLDGAGNVYVTGQSYGGAGTGSDYATVKYDGATGQQLWVSRYNGAASGDDFAAAIAVDGSGNIVVTGNSWGGAENGPDYATVKYSGANGAPFWSGGSVDAGGAARYRGEGTVFDMATAVTVDSSNNVYVTGSAYEGEFTRFDYATVKYSGSTGSPLWSGIAIDSGGAVRYAGPGTGYDEADALVVDASGNVYVTGRSDGSSTAVDYATVKYLPDGSPAPGWPRRYDATNGLDLASSIAVDSSGNVYVSGASEGNGTGPDYTTLKYTSTGALLWERRYDNGGNDQATALVLDGQRTLYVTGLSADPITGLDYATVRYREDGTEIWSCRFDGGLASDDTAAALAVDSTGNCVVTGSSLGTAATPEFLTVRYPAVPATPGTPSLTVESATRITVRWTDQSTNETGFTIERKLASAPDSAFASAGQVGAGAGAGSEITFNDTSLQEATAYTYRIRASNGSGTSLPSGTQNATTLPAAPDGLVAQGTGSQTVSLTWTDHSSHETGFRIERKTGAGVFTTVGTRGADVTQYPDSGLAAETTYTYQVRALLSTLTSDPSNAAVVVPLGMPTSLVVRAPASNQAQLSWTDRSGNESGFKVERSADGGLTWPSLASLDMPAPDIGSTVSYTDRSVVAGSAYLYRVRAYAGSSAAPAALSSASNQAGIAPLPAPTNLVVTVPAPPAGSTRLDLSWEYAGSGQTGFKIEWSTNGVTFNSGPVAGASARSYQYSGLSVATTYTFRIRATNASGDSSYSNTTSATTLPQAPGAPTGLAAVVLSQTQVRLFWNDNSTNEESFRVDRRTGTTGAFTQIAQLSPATTSYLDETGLAGTLYSYQVRAVNSGGATPSETAVVTTLPNPPASPTGLAVSPTLAPAGINQLRLTWSVIGTGITGFRIERKNGSGAFAEVAVDPPLTGAARAYTDGGLNPDTLYTYRLSALNAGGASAPSAEAAGTTLPLIPAAPSNLVGTAISATEINLSWRDNGGSQSGIVVERQVDTGAYTLLRSLPAHTAGYQDRSVSPGHAYFYRVKAVSAGGPAAYSNTAGPVRTVAVPATPTGLRVKPPAYDPQATGPDPRSTTLVLTWTNGAGTDRVQIERQQGTSAFIVVAVLATAAATYRDEGLAPSTTYTYRVRAGSAGGESSYSAAVSGATLAAPLAAPTGLAAAPVSPTTLTVTWKDASAGEGGWKLERKTGPLGDGSGFAVIASVASSTVPATGEAVTYMNSGLAPNTAYTFRVRAYAGTTSPVYSPYSAPAAAATLPSLPGAPGSFQATAISPTQVDLSWASSTGAVGYRLERQAAAGSSFTRLASLAPSATAYSNTGLTAGTTYTYRLTPLGVGGDGPAVQKSVTTPAGLAAEATRASLAAPSSLTATNPPPTASGVHLKWSYSGTGHSGFLVERKDGTTASTAAFGVVGTVTDPSARAFADSRVGAGATYTYRVRAFAGTASAPSGLSTPSNLAAATTPALVPAPAGLVATALPGLKVALSWNSPARCDSAIERRMGTLAFSRIATVAAGQPSQYVNAGVLANTTYTYQVRAVQGTATSQPSPPATVTTTLRAPAVPTTLVVSVPVAPDGQNRLDLSWKDGSTNETAFKIERRAGSGPFVLVALVNSMTGATTGSVVRYSDAGLTPGTAYTYQVRAANADSDSAAAGPATRSTLPPSPGAPSGLSARVVTATQIDLSWSALGGASAYVLERQAGDQTVTITPAGTGTTYSDRTVTADTCYTYQVRAAGPWGRSAPSAPAVVTTPPPAPGAPTGLSAGLVSPSQVRLEWTAPATGTVTGYEVRRKTGTGSYGAIGTAAAGATSYVDTSLVPAAGYTYQVVARNAGGDSLPSNAASVRIPGGTLVVLPDPGLGLDFGSLTSSAPPRDQPLVLENTGSGTLLVRSVIVSGSGFSLVENAGPYSIEPGHRQPLTLRFTRPGGGFFVGKVSVTSSDPNQPGGLDAILTGRGN